MCIRDRGHAAQGVGDEQNEQQQPDLQQEVQRQDALEEVVELEQNIVEHGVFNVAQDSYPVLAGQSTG